MLKQLILTFSFVLFAVVSRSEPVEISPENELVNIGTQSYLFADETGEMTYEEVQNQSFKLNDREIFNLGLTDQVHWIKFTVQSKLDQQLVLKLGNARMNEMDLYYTDDDGETVIMEGGQKVPFNEREYKVNKFLFPLNMNGVEERTFYLKVSGFKQLNFPAVVGVDEKVAGSLVKENLLFGLYFGVMAAMFFYNVFIYFTTRLRSYLYYILYIASVVLVQASLEGYGYQYLWPESTEFESLSLFFVNPATALFSVLFFINFVDIKRYSRILYYIVIGSVSLYAVQLLLTAFGLHRTAYAVMNIAAMCLALSLITAALYAAIKGSRTGLFFFVAWFFFLTSVIIFVLTDEGLIGFNLFTSNVLQFGSGLAVLMLAFGLADQINVLRKRHEESQARALAVAKENERLTQNRKMELEKKVDERTQELQITIMDLNEAMDELKNAQTQLVDQEKMASLGQLTAGIAHEINNPINFVTSNVNPLRRDVEDVFDVLDRFFKLQTPEDFEQQVEEIKKQAEEAELDFVREEIFSLLDGIDEGAKRTAEIVRGLKVFSRTEEQDVKRVDLIQGLESTLTLLNSATKDVIEIKREFEPIPQVECYAGKMNQVFMNILSNAVHALRSDEDNNDKTITLRTSSSGDQVQIEISDNGPGIPDEVKDRIFEPFYTSKEVGEGTGLGLSISKNIVAKHNGDLYVESEQGKGSTFFIILPKNMEDKE